MGTVENVVLLDESGHGIGVAPKTGVHHGTTPLHLAFSCYVFDADDQLLVTRRALDKTTFPGVWTNSACGHPAPEESMRAAVRRRVQQELGLSVEQVRLVLPEFRYTAHMNGIRENEMCPVFTARAAGRMTLDPAEVGDAVWEPWTKFSQDVLSGRREVSSWCRMQVEGLDALGPLPGEWPAADPSRLPPAVTV
ncbi:isopentenyl-diphosphate Delta-isomerase [Aeromicrobium chenweiae]|uniref:Isopentenyl-diphosphate Delta-isomerase n=1 Tax=Aeromicrobium chenweiae TaxID=2079793 RepID=A0A2S0WHW4_9ACTN|nr:isopentenyl-diphosphate Delta-isomerase [Aeromicrobium chenweiae]AWB90931.1 isopentenyl-diphosphate delta-isomerase [Aeromicrobium chenweiae]TGN32151.1 isopentenyl-diphosphate Delta-isomerase [Aeromicrobium chenweiae]